MADADAIVLDHGSGVMKAGLAGEDTPRSILPTIIHSTDHGGDQQNYIGRECLQYQVADFKHPIERGIVQDWDALERLWEYVFTHELQANPETTPIPIMCTSSPMAPRKQQEQMAQLLFESHKVNGFYFTQQSVLSLFASGRTRGIVAEVGHGSGHAIPVFEGYALPHAALHCPSGGVDISAQLSKLLARQHPTIMRNISMQTVHAIKEGVCGVSGDSNQSNEGDMKPFELPDGTVLEVDYKTRTVCSEQLFHPRPTTPQSESALSEDYGHTRPDKGIHELVAESVGMCDHDLQKDLWKAVVVAGGTTILPGFCHRFQSELTALEPEANAKVVPSPFARERGYNSHRKHAAWIGGSLFASLSTFRDIQITKQEWEEYHEAILDRKCF